MRNSLLAPFDAPADPAPRPGDPVEELEDIAGIGIDLVDGPCQERARERLRLGVRARRKARQFLSGLGRESDVRRLPSPGTGEGSAL